jgi:hypothetical protein
MGTVRASSSVTDRRPSLWVHATIILGPKINHKEKALKE